MKNYKLPNKFVARVNCITKEGGNIDYIIASKELTDKMRWALFSVDDEGSVKQVSTADSPTKFDKIIWKNHKEQEED